MTHYFGYQGRCSHPSLVDCSLGSTYGFAAGVLIDHGMTAMAVSVQNIANPPELWRVGGVPLLAMVRSEPKSGYKRATLVVPSEEVDLNGPAYQAMKAVERTWKAIDHYSNPGPIQFFDFGRDHLALTLQAYFNQKTLIQEKIRAVCQSIQNDCLFVDHPNLLLAALSSLKSTKNVVNSMSAKL